MRRLFGVLLLSCLVAAAAWSIWSLWPAGDLMDTSEPHPRVLATVSTSAYASPDHGGAARLRAMPGESRRELIAQRDAPAASLTSPDTDPDPVPVLVRVHGHVRRAGLPVADYDVLFRPFADAGGGDEDWDFSDEDGHYEVLLPAAHYAIHNGEEGPFLWNVVVPAGKTELVLNLDLPPGW